MRVGQKKGLKGSLKWIQLIINQYPHIINTKIKASFSWGKETIIDWVSPLKIDQYAEYRDQAFIDKLDINLTKKSLRDFWPALGPQWDALGKTHNGIINTYVILP